MLFEFLYKMIDVMMAYFSKITEVNVKNNLDLIYELLDEILDFGYPQNSGDRSSENLHHSAGHQEPVSVHMCVFVCVFICVFMCVYSGQVLSALVSGLVLMKHYPSRMPECKFEMNDKIVMDRQGKGGSSEDTGKRYRTTKDIILPLQSRPSGLRGGSDKTEGQGRHQVQLQVLTAGSEDGGTTSNLGGWKKKPTQRNQQL
ncbi:AP-2 complex subunit mu-B isoform X1 [Seriola aureovittata]|uniref:AP-2 complex subunit mu-B isoform X1 n=1 Tax=Seriola aureovittata TaxID=2871759 RepID=UPI0024BEE094|nr:AP-2 complex subunit mu-B isoform X1 [Seriola aureovittata]XP_056229641.1 AP-2 complex subunit mu-B isoform X1 [Seriola aureovittata]XP_056229642.1 AP-2 complex subunit mu-B isoform X1 [Seriola aureovittata]